jgi:hypothetical protein
MWKKLGSRSLSLAAVAGLAVVTGASIADVFRQDSLAPIWLVLWIPAVLIGAVYWPRGGKSCSGRIVPRSRA